MRELSKRTQVVIALFCCCFVAGAATAHLVHTSSLHHKHGKLIADIACSLDTFNLLPISLAGFVPPLLATLLIRLYSKESQHGDHDGLFEIQIGRAPPACI